MESHFCQGKKRPAARHGRHSSAARRSLGTFSTGVFGSPTIRLPTLLYADGASINCLTPLWNYDILRAIFCLGCTEYF